MSLFNRRKLNLRRIGIPPPKKVRIRIRVNVDPKLVAQCCLDEEVGLQCTLKVEQDFHIRQRRERERGGGTGSGFSEVYGV